MISWTHNNLTMLEWQLDITKYMEGIDNTIIWENYLLLLEYGKII